MTCASSAAQTAQSVSISSGPLVAVLPFLIGMRILASQMQATARSPKTWLLVIGSLFALVGAVFLSGALL